MTNWALKDNAKGKRKIINLPNTLVNMVVRTGIRIDTKTSIIAKCYKRQNAVKNRYAPRP